jgi:hypothetical protein
MTSKTECLNTNKPENNFVIENKNEKDNKNKEREVKVIKIDKKLTRKNSVKNFVKENENLKHLLLYLIENNYQYISYIYGGFETVHNEIINNFKKINLYSEINLLNHNDEKCYICKKNKKNVKTISPKVNNKISITKFNIKSLSPKKIFSSAKLKDNKIDMNIKSQNKIENINKIITLEEVNKMISNSQNFAAPCQFVNSEKPNLVEKNKDNDGLLILYDNKLFVIKTPMYNNNPIEIMHEITLNNIKNVKIKSKFYAHINFINCKNMKNSKEILIAKLKYELDSEKFVNSVNNAKKLHS